MKLTAFPRKLLRIMCAVRLRSLSLTEFAKQAKTSVEESCKSSFPISLVWNQLPPFAETLLGLIESLEAQQVSLSDAIKKLQTTQKKFEDLKLEGVLEALSAFAVKAGARLRELDLALQSIHDISKVSTMPDNDTHEP